MTDPILSTKALNVLLREAVLRNFYKSVTVLLNNGADINARVGKFSCLIEASKLGLSNMVKFLLGHGADETIVCLEYERNCAHWAYLEGHFELGNWLVYKTDVSINQRDIYEKSAMDYRIDHMLKINSKSKSVGVDRRFEAHVIPEKEKDIIIMNGNENNIACGSGLRGTRWLQLNKQL